MAGDAGDGSDGRRAVARQAEEEPRIELVGHGIERSVENQTPAVGGHEVGVLVLGIEIGDLLGVHHRDLVAQTDDETLAVLAPRTGEQAAQQRGVGRRRGIFRQQGLAAALHRGLQLLGHDGLEQVVDAVDAESPDGIVVVSRGDDHLAAHLGPGEDVETHAVGELHVHEDDVGPVGRVAQPFDGADHRTLHARDAQVVEMLLDDAPQVGLGRDFVFDDQYVVGFHNSGSWTRKAASLCSTAIGRPARSRYC